MYTWLYAIKCPPITQDILFILPEDSDYRNVALKQLYIMLTIIKIMIKIII